MIAQSKKLVIRQTLDIMHEGRLVELRAIGVPTRSGKGETWSGYYLDYNLAAEAAIEAEDAGAEGVYQTLQVIHPGLYARSPDQWTRSPKHTTADRDVRATPWVYVDVDPRRPSGISSTEAELDAAIRTRDEILDWFQGDYKGAWSRLICALSGNGAHLLIEATEETPPAAELLKIIDALWSDSIVDIDKSVSKPAQLTKLYGTVARKGHPIADRPHRRSTITRVIDNDDVGE